MYLEGVNMTRSDNSSNSAAIQITDGTATIILKGSNTIIAQNSSGASHDICGIELAGEDANVHIKGTAGSSLDIQTGGQTAIGSRMGGHCGNITIEDATITASTKNGGMGSSAAIGTSSGFHGDTSCGIIRIIRSSITASVVDAGYGKAAVIGTGGTDGGNVSCKGIEITLKRGESKATFLSRLTGDYFTQVALVSIEWHIEYLRLCPLVQCRRGQR
mgnify:CR=1 FL=1